jgi:hypothetical protein
VSEQSFFWIAGIFAVIVGAIGGALWKHVIEDAKVRERLASLETDNDTTKAEVKTLREKLHALRDELQAAIASWYLKVMGKGK